MTWPDLIQKPNLDNAYRPSKVPSLAQHPRHDGASRVTPLPMQARRIIRCGHSFNVQAALHPSLYSPDITRCLRANNWTYHTADKLTYLVQTKLSSLNNHDHSATVVTAACKGCCNKQWPRLPYALSDWRWITNSAVKLRFGFLRFRWKVIFHILLCEILNSTHHNPVDASYFDINAEGRNLLNVSLHAACQFRSFLRLSFRLLAL